MRFKHTMIVQVPLEVLVALFEGFQGLPVPRGYTPDNEHRGDDASDDEWVTIVIFRNDTLGVGG